MVGDFGRATSVEAVAAGHWRGLVDEGWFAPTGPNGGYLAAIVLRAATLAVADAERAPRTLTLHYLRAPQAGEVDVMSTIERSGRSVTTLSLRLEQDGRLCAIGLAAFSRSIESATSYAFAMPDAPPADSVERVPDSGRAPEIFHRLDTRPCLGFPPFQAHAKAITGGWLGFSEPAVADAPAVACLLDAWWPAPWTRTTRPVLAPTLEMTFHFRARLPLHAEPGLLLGRFTSRHAADGFAEEDGALWTPDGTLVGHSRQLALLRA